MAAVPAASAPVHQSAPPESIEEVELLDDDLVEIQTVPPEAAPEPPPAPVIAQHSDFGLDFDEDEEEPPASSKRPIAQSMDQALADAAEREVPLKTPPPESGPQEASVPPSPELDALLEPGAAERAAVDEGIPTSAQLGNTVMLEEGGPAELEVHVPSDQPGPDEAIVHEDEAVIPQREAVSNYDRNLAPPPEAASEYDARVESEGHRALSDELSDVPRISSSSPAPSSSSDQGGPEAFERLQVNVSGVTSLVGAAQRFQPKTFLELLDASLKLGS